MSDWSTDPDGFNEFVIREFRASAGVVGGELAHMHLLLLTTTDARRGRRRTTPLAYQRRAERYVVIASNGGATTHPKWFRNLERDPNVTVEVGAERFPATARILDGAERDAVFAAIVARAPAAGAFQENAGRTIPVIELVRLMGSADRVSAGIAEGVTKSKSFCSAVGRVLSADNSWPSGVARGRSPWFRRAVRVSIS